MAIKKTELYSALWASCDELRGGMDASKYKDYVLVLLFVKYVSDKYAGKEDASIRVPRGAAFKDMLALIGRKNIGEEINKIISRLARANELSGVIDVADFNDENELGKGKDMVDTLSKLVAIFGNPALDFSANRADGDDLLGDAYEYLMRNFATESGKSKGQFYTPAEVSRIIAKVIGVGRAERANQTVYDPTCGSGSLLLKASAEAPRGLTIYGQEMDNATQALARMNMILHNNAGADIRKDNTLSRPQFTERNGLKTFDFVVANPPFSFKSWRNGFDPENDTYGRFEDGVPPAKNGDFAFLLHVIRSMKSTAKGAVILPHGVLFRGNAEADIRRNLILKGYIKGVIGLPANLFYGTGIPACIVVLDKETAQARRGVFLVDASKGFASDGPKNRLREQDIHRIVDVFNKQDAVLNYSRMVPMAKIEANEFNLNLSLYIDSSEPEDLQDIEGHLKGGIPNSDVEALATYWQVFPSIRAVLFEKERAGYSRVKVQAGQVQQAILEHSEFSKFKAEVQKTFDKWWGKHKAALTKLKRGDRPKALIAEISEDLLDAFEGAKVVDAYDVYQRLMIYWAETMQDDVYLIAEQGWVEAAALRRIVENGSKHKEEADLKQGKMGLKADLVPPGLMIARWFRAEKMALDALKAEAVSLTANIEEMEEEHGGDEGLLAEARADSGKVTKASTKARLEAIEEGEEEDAADEVKILKEYMDLSVKEADASKKVKEAVKALDEKVIVKYERLTEAEVKDLVVEGKWLASLTTAVETEVDLVSQRLSSRVKELAERYETTLSSMTNRVKDMEAKVAANLLKMGFKW